MSIPSCITHYHLSIALSTRQFRSAIWPESGRKVAEKSLSQDLQILQKIAVPTLHSLFLRRKELTKEERLAITWKPALCAYMTYVAVFAIALFLVRQQCDVSFSVVSVSVALNSSAMWHIDFHVKYPLLSSSCLIYDNGDGVEAKIGSSNAAVLKTSHTLGSSGRHKSFSVDLATEGNNHSNFVVAASPRVFELDLDLKLSAKKKNYMLEEEYGHFDIRCRNLPIGYQKIKCLSSFERLKPCCHKLLN